MSTVGWADTETDVPTCQSRVLVELRGSVDSTHRLRPQSRTRPAEPPCPGDRTVYRGTSRREHERVRFSRKHPERHLGGRRDLFEVFRYSPGDPGADS